MSEGTNSKKKKKLIILSTAIFLALSGVFWKVNPDNESNRDIRSFTTIAKEGTLPGLITASGELQSEKSVNISPKRQGILEEVFVEAGDQVIKGQLIARMDDGDLTYKLNELKADFEKQKTNYIRRKYLLQEGAISQENYDDYKNLFLKSEAKLNQLEIQINDIDIRAPFEGIITSKYAVEGAFVTPTKTSTSTGNGTSPQISIVELSQGLEVIAKVPESDIGRIQVGQDATVRVDSFPEKRFQAKVRDISPRAIKSNNVTSFEVTLLLITPPPILRIGMSADIEFNTGETSISTLVPTVAIVTQKGMPGLLFVGDKKQPTFRPVELGASSGSKTAILNGVNPGDQIFIDLPPWSKQSRN